MNKVIMFPGETTFDLPASRVLDEARAAGMKTVVVVGYLDDGEEYFASSTSDGPAVLWLLERLKMLILSEAE